MPRNTDADAVPGGTDTGRERTADESDGNEPDPDSDELDTGYYRIGSDASHEEFLAVARVYARDVTESYDLAVDVKALDWEVSKRAKRRAGAVKHRNGNPETVSLTWRYFQERGWGGMAEIIRHELIHVHLLNEYDDGTHGERFAEWAETLRTSTHCDRFTPPEWWVICEDCDSRIARYRRSKLVGNPEAYRCGGCGGTLRVEANEGRD